jgi:hypothetical protein
LVSSISSKKRTKTSQPDVSQAEVFYNVKK